MASTTKPDDDTDDVEDAEPADDDLVRSVAHFPRSVDSQVALGM